MLKHVKTKLLTVLLLVFLVLGVVAVLTPQFNFGVAKALEKTVKFSRNTICVGLK